MSDAEIARLRELAAKATPAPWEAKPPDDGEYGCTVRHVLGAPNEHGKPMVAIDILDEEAWPGIDNGAFIVALRNAWPSLLARIEAGEQMRDAVERLLADPYGCPMCDSGKLRNEAKPHWDNCPYLIARAALSEFRKAKQGEGAK